MPEILEGLGKVYSKLGMLAESKELYKASIVAIPNQSEIMIKYTKILSRLGLHSETVLLLGANWNGIVFNAKKEFILGEAHFALREFEFAKKRFEVVVESPQLLFKYAVRSCQRLFNYAITYGETRKFKERLIAILKSFYSTTQ